MSKIKWLWSVAIAMGIVLIYASLSAYFVKIDEWYLSLTLPKFAFSPLIMTIGWSIVYIINIAVLARTGDRQYNMVYDFLCFPRNYGKFYHIDNTDCPDLCDLYNANQRRLHFYDILAGVGSMVFISMRDMLGSDFAQLSSFD